MITGSAKWFFEISEMPPVVRGYCTTDDQRIQPVMLTMAVELMEKANKFDGIPFRIHNVPNIKAPLMVSFSLIFKTTKDAVAYIDDLKHMT